MGIATQSFQIKTKGRTDVIDITEEVSELLRNSKFKEGSALIFVPGSTAGITSIEFEPGLLKDYPEFFERVISSRGNYHHDDTWHDGNGYSHVRAALQGASFTVPFQAGKLLLGTWQQIVLVDFDNRPRSRTIIVQLQGE